eukprot:2193271-Heterocapsa_arctica.AAC.1
MQRRRLSKFGAVRLSRIEARKIIRMKKKASNLFATVAVKKYVYVDDMMIPVGSEDMAYASAFELILEYGNDHLANIFDRLQKRLNKNRTVPIDTLLNDINTRTKANIIQ